MSETYACSLCDKENKIGSFVARITGDVKNEAVKGKFVLMEEGHHHLNLLTTKKVIPE